MNVFEILHCHKTKSLSGDAQKPIMLRVMAETHKMGSAEVTTGEHRRVHCTTKQVLRCLHDVYMSVDT